MFISSFQGDFDIIGGSSPITEAEVIKVISFYVFMIAFFGDLVFL
jgi:histidyl-tRNA synthetase